MYQSIPPVMSASPTAITGRGPILVTSACETPATRTTVPAVARNVRPVLQRRVAEHLLHVERQQEEVREHDRAEEDAAHFAPVTVFDAEDAERHDRRRAPRLDEEERHEEHAGGDQQPDRAAGRPADVRRLRDRVHEQREAARDRDRAGRVEAAEAGMRLSRTTARVNKSTSDSDRAR